MHMKKRGKNEGIEKLIKIINKCYYIKPIIAFLGTVWFPIIIKYLGQVLKLVNEKDYLTILGWICTIAVYGSVLGISLISVQESKILVRYETNLHIYEHLIKSLDDLCDANYDRILTHLSESETKKSSRNIYKNTVEPIKQLKDIAREIKECFSEIADFQRDDLIVSMAYNFPRENNDWFWIDSKYMEGGLSTEQLFTNTDSALYHVAKNEDFIFFSNKKTAHDEKCYIYDSKDKEGTVGGSIICMKIPILLGNEIVAQIVLSVSTYGVFLCGENEEKAVGEIIEKVLLRRFSKRIRVELAHLYIRKCI